MSELPRIQDLAPPAHDPRRQAKFLYFMGWKVGDIAAWTGEPISTVSSWKTRDKWDEVKPIDRVEGALEQRLVQLIVKDHKTGHDFKEIDLLGRQVVNLARVRRFGQEGGHEGDLNPVIGERNRKAAKHRPKRNEISEEQHAKLRAIFEESSFGFQRRWGDAGGERTRLILKSRQIGATWYFAREAFLDAIETGRNQIFLSASKSQAHVFRSYILDFAREAEVEITGDPIVLPNGATLYFLGTSSRTAQSYHGNFYFDEFFWTYRFKELNKVAAAMASQKRWRKTYLSTPSSITHEAYGFFTGEDWNRGRAKSEREPIDFSHAALAGGSRGPDRIWRQIVTLLDAERDGCDLFDVEELRRENSAPEFANLYLCEFIDDTQSVFPLAVLQKCQVDAWVEWRDFKPLLARPFGNRPVWLGYDPSDGGDAAALVVIAPPDKPGGKFRILEKFQFRGMNFVAQAEAIEKITKRYNVAYIGIDATGMGVGVYQLVKQFFPNTRDLKYSPELKTAMVLKAYDVIHSGRVEYDAGWTDVTASLMAIRKTLTASGRAVTYEAGRTVETGHADLAWAIMHVFLNEPLEAANGLPARSFMEIH